MVFIKDPCISKYVPFDGDSPSSALAFISERIGCPIDKLLLISGGGKPISFDRNLPELVDFSFKCDGGKGAYGTRLKNEAKHKKTFEDFGLARDKDGRFFKDVKAELELKKYLLRPTNEKLKDNSQKENRDLPRESSQFLEENTGLLFEKSIEAAPLPPRPEMSFGESIASGLAIKKQILIPETPVMAPKIALTLSESLPEPVTAVTKTLRVIDLASMKRKDDIERFSVEEVRATLKSLGLKAGGSFIEACDRLWKVSQHPELLFHKDFLAKQ